MVKQNQPWSRLALRLVATLALTAVAPLAASAADDEAEPRDPAPIRISGKGARATDPFRLEAGLATWHASHGGKSNFQVSLVDDKGSKVDMLINAIGRAEGTWAGHVRKGGSYRLQVEADGPWELSIAQPKPRPDDTLKTPQAFSGKGREVTAFFHLDAGSHVFATKHTGKGIFRVSLLDERGRFEEQLAGVIGVQEGSKVIRVEKPGTYLLSVAADGGWSVTVE